MRNTVFFGVHRALVTEAQLVRALAAVIESASQQKGDHERDVQRGGRPDRG